MDCDSEINIVNQREIEMLFHYHFWTPKLEELEKFYTGLGFRVHQRIGKIKGEFKSFNPPLTWDDFRDQGVLFRIIEMKKDNINITFGYGKRTIFDHIGFIVTKEEETKICEKARSLSWRVEEGERRTFISTPYKFSLELQTHHDAIDGDGKVPSIERMVISTPFKDLEKNLTALFGKNIPEIRSELEDQVMLKEVKFTSHQNKIIEDPNGVILSFSTDTTWLEFYQPTLQEQLKSYLIPEEQQKYTAHPIDAILKCEKEKDRFPIVIFYKGAPAGFFVLHGWNGVKEYHDNQKALLIRAYSIQSTFQGKGIAQKSLSLLPDFVKKFFPEVNEIVLAVNHGNSKAQHIYKKSGFTDKGIRTLGSKGQLFIMHMDINH